MKPVAVSFTSYQKSVAEALDAIGAPEVLAKQKAVLIKPNLTNDTPPPVTTPVECCAAIVDYVRRHSEAEIAIAEGCGEPYYETDHVFKALGYTALAKQADVDLVDLDKVPTKRLKDKSCKVFREFHMPEIALTHYVISAPVLKAHSLADITGAMKNMMGFAQSRYYQQGGHWKKSAFHNRMHQSIAELNLYRAPDLSVIDARIGLAEYHLGGAECDPPVNKILAGFSAREVDRLSAKLLGLDWRSIPHLKD